MPLLFFKRVTLVGTASGHGGFDGAGGAVGASRCCFAGGVTGKPWAVVSGGIIGPSAGVGSSGALGDAACAASGGRFGKGVGKTTATLGGDHASECSSLHNRREQRSRFRAMSELIGSRGTREAALWIGSWTPWSCCSSLKIHADTQDVFPFCPLYLKCHCLLLRIYQFYDIRAASRERCSIFFLFRAFLNVPWQTNAPLY